MKLKVSMKTPSKLAWWWSSKPLRNPGRSPLSVGGESWEVSAKVYLNLFWIRPFIDIKTGVHTAVWNFHTPVWILWKAILESTVLRFALFSRRTASESLLLHRGHPSGTRRVVDRVVSSFSPFCRSSPPIWLELVFTNATAFVPLHLDESFEPSGGWHAPAKQSTSLDPSLFWENSTQSLIVIYFWLILLQLASQP